MIMTKTFFSHENLINLYIEIIVFKLAKNYKKKLCLEEVKINSINYTLHLFSLHHLNIHRTLLKIPILKSTPFDRSSINLNNHTHT